MGQQPEDRLDGDMEIDSETAENVNGGFTQPGLNHKAEGHNKHPASWGEPGHGPEMLSE
jgi:hypothetical protein